MEILYYCLHYIFGRDNWLERTRDQYAGGWRGHTIRNTLRLVTDFHGEQYWGLRLLTNKTQNVKKLRRLYPVILFI